MYNICEDATGDVRGVHEKSFFLFITPYGRRGMIYKTYPSLDFEVEPDCETFGDDIK